MSIAHSSPVSPSEPFESGDADSNVISSQAFERLHQVLDRVQSRIAPVWPLKDYVAVNPYLGFTGQSFLDARKSLRAVSDFETLMPVDYFRDQFNQGSIMKADFEAAIGELVADGVSGAETIDVNRVISLLLGEQTGLEDPAAVGTSGKRRVIRVVAEVLDDLHQTDWLSVIRDEISKHCSAHYDEGQSPWPSPWKDLPLYQAWRLSAQQDRTVEILGVKGFRRFVASLPHDPQSAIASMLEQLQVPEELWEEYLECHAMATIGWSAWTRYQHRQAAAVGEENTDFFGLLAMRLAYDLGLLKYHAIDIDWISMLHTHQALFGDQCTADEGELVRYSLLKASEIAYRRQLLSELLLEGDYQDAQSHQDALGDSGQCESSSASGEVRPSAQMVFCIDVRSERMRRQLEASCQRIETFGFAGFFGLPIAFVPMGESEPIDQLPVLVSPQFKVQEGFDGVPELAQQQAQSKRSLIRSVRQSWKEFQSSAVSCFGFVESAGLTYAWQLVSRTLGVGSRSARFDGVAKHDRKHLGPCLHGLEEQGVTLSKQIDMAESILKGIGIVDSFARLVVLCGHGSRTENNPLQAGLDCGACGGHTGEANARFAAKLFNQQAVREGLAARGIVIGDDVHFLAALHNTTTDEISFFDVDRVPPSHLADLQELSDHIQVASSATRSERQGTLSADSEADLIQRSVDWSEVRPEWGLAGNAAFIAAPRGLTQHVTLAGRSFLHSYDYRKDPGFQVLEQIMTAPMVVANWINLQYYASTVDPTHFGSGSKTIHNVVGRFGILSGNSGDLTTGLPWQSVHDGENYQHHPLRLTVVIAAPREAIEGIIEKHASIRDLVSGGWLHLVAIDEGKSYRFSGREQWVSLQDAPVDHSPAGTFPSALDASTTPDASRAAEMIQ